MEINSTEEFVNFIGSYHVKVKTLIGERHALITNANIGDMPIWDFDWISLWRNTGFDYQNIVRITCDNILWGLLRYSIFPISESQNVLEIEQLEAHPKSRGTIDNRLVEPVGKWLIWYASQVALYYCPCNDSDDLLLLSSLTDAFDYYRDVIKLDHIGNAPGVSGEDLYAFRFTRQQATEFCRNHEQQWGKPLRINS